MSESNSNRRTPKEDRAINLFLESGEYRPLLSTYPNYRFENKTTGVLVIHSISTLVENYEQNLKETQKQRARLRRQILSSDLKTELDLEVDS